MATKLVIEATRNSSRKMAGATLFMAGSGGSRTGGRRGGPPAGKQPPRAGKIFPGEAGVNTKKSRRGRPPAGKHPRRPGKICPVNAGVNEKRGGRALDPSRLPCVSTVIQDYSGGVSPKRWT